MEATTSRIEDYALIGDCESAALVSRNGSIDWLAWPRFDSPACFAALLGTKDNGRWRICPAADFAVSRRYRGDSMILETTMTTSTGSVLIVDFMPLQDNRSDLIRIVTGLEGTVQMHSEIALRFDYGSATPWVTRIDARSHRFIAGPDLVTLRTAVEEHGEQLKTVSEFVVNKGDTLPFTLTWSPSHHPIPDEIHVGQALARTEAAWKEWSSRCKYTGHYRDIVIRSLITLKALTYAPTGGICAAPTTSLPAHIGGVRNWDYRFCWLRDATLTLLSLINAGYVEEAGAWRDWLLRAAAGSPEQVQIMYGLSGERSLREFEIPWLAGYENSAPVRIGNAAAAQMQLDVYGEVMDALHQASEAGLAASDDAWALQVALVNHVEKIWRSPDQGLWEVRGAPQHFTHSKVMAWVALDRAIKSAERHSLEGPLDRWRQVRDTIHAEVCEKAFNQELGCFVQAYGSSLLDAALLLMTLTGFLPPDDPRMISTVTCIEKNLLVDGFMLRYDSFATDDGLPGGEGAFLPCSFWLADNYVLMGRRDEAVAMFERLCALSNDLGLLSEDYDPGLKRARLARLGSALSHTKLRRKTRARNPLPKVEGCIRVKCPSRINHRAHRIQHKRAGLAQRILGRLVGTAAGNLAQQPVAAKIAAVVQWIIHCDAGNIDHLNIESRRRRAHVRVRHIDIAKAVLAYSQPRRNRQRPVVLRHQYREGRIELADHADLAAEHVKINIRRSQHHRAQAGNNAMLSGQAQRAQRLRRQPAAHAVAHQANVIKAAQPGEQAEHLRQAVTRGGGRLPVGKIAIQRAL